MNKLWTTLLILKLLITTIIAQYDYCTKICDACVEDSISCTKPGFQQMPVQMSKTIKKFILQNQRFSDRYLSRENFSALSPPNVELTYLIIRKSNIDLIKSETFIDLTKLKSLDLTYNNDLVIQSRSFYGLNLTLLKLDHNENLKFQRNAFDGIIVQSLHMSYSSISQIPYSLLKPILPSLTQLFLDNNNIVTLDSKYQVHFQNLKVLNFENNPISCFCSMKWLTEVYLYRRKNGKLIKNTFSETVENSPTCAEPLYMKGKYLHDVSLSMFLCDPPTLTQLKIDFQSLTHTELSCSAIQNIDEATMSVEWFTDIIQGIGQKLSSFFNPIGRVMLSKKVYTESVVIYKKSSTDSFQCIARNVNGNTTATVRINWPPKEFSKENDKRVFPNSSDGFQKPEEENYLFQKRFTLLEMLGSVIGTFAFTLLVFFLIYKICFINKQLHRKAVPPVNGYTTYEATGYSDSQTYDVPGNSYPQSVLLPMPHLASTANHFIDFKTQKKFYQTT